MSANSLNIVLFDEEVRLHFGLSLDAIITAAAMWWGWRCRCRSGA